MKYLIVLALLAYLYVTWRKQRRPGAGGGKAAPGASPASDGGQAPQEMVRCDHCGLHLPRNESLTDGRGHVFCSSQHREQGGA